MFWVQPMLWCKEPASCFKLPGMLEPPGRMRSSISDLEETLLSCADFLQNCSPGLRGYFRRMTDCNTKPGTRTTLIKEQTPHLTSVMIST